MISDERRDKALTYLVETDEEHARKKSYFKGLERQEKTVYSFEFLKTKGNGTVEERKAMANSSSSLIEHLEKIADAQLKHEIMENKRHTEELMIECWRSENANRRKGNL
jgi:hypothetical protein